MPNTYFFHENSKYMAFDVTAIVPIKAHSERLPEKNFRDFNGRPLYYWILDTLESVEEVDKIIINTDAEEIIDDPPEQFDIDISVRPERLRDDEVTTNIIEYEIARTDSDLYLHTYCTCPLLTSETISNAIKEFVNSPSYDSLLPVTKRQKRFYDAEFNPINHDPHDLSPSQDIPPVYEDNSVLFIYTEETFEEFGYRIGENPLPFEIDEREAIEIDYLSEFELAKSLHKQRLSSKVTDQSE
jgi:N-acylneuraminate cytidylyltransferase